MRMRAQCKGRTFNLQRGGEQRTHGVLMGGAQACGTSAPTPPYTSCLSEVSFQTFQRPYFWTLSLKAKQCCSSKNRTRLCPFVSRQLFKEPTPHQESWGSTDHIRLPGGSRLVRVRSPSPTLLHVSARMDAERATGLKQRN